MRGFLKRWKWHIVLVLFLAFLGGTTALLYQLSLPRPIVLENIKVLKDPETQKEYVSGFVHSYSYRYGMGEEVIRQKVLKDYGLLKEKEPRLESFMMRGSDEDFDVGVFKKYGEKKLEVHYGRMKDKEFKHFTIELE